MLESLLLQIQRRAARPSATISGMPVSAPMATDAASARRNDNDRPSLETPLDF